MQWVFKVKEFNEDGEVIGESRLSVWARSEMEALLKADEIAYQNTNGEYDVIPMNGNQDRR